MRQNYTGFLGREISGYIYDGFLKKIE